MCKKNIEISSLARKTEIQNEKYANENKQLIHTVNLSLTQIDSIEKGWITDIIEKNENKEYYGTIFDEYVKYCNGELDVEKHTDEKSLESNESINKYLQIYAKFFNN